MSSEPDLMDDGQAAFDRLHPAVQHHIVNSLGWSGLRPTQQAAVAPILDGQHCLLLAPTAGGKTEAAIFPVLSRMLSEDWRGLSVLYVCPIRALLNNLEPRLSWYFGLVGRRVGVWHGDISDSIKRKTLKEPPDLLLTTPESLEGMLISANDEKRNLLLDVRLIIVDELHAFCGDDRGWHVRCVIQRLARLSGRRIQVLGLTATVGNPQELIDWLVSGQSTTVVGVGHSGTEADLVIDHVGSLENAATIISRLHAGEKRLVFCDSRARTEELSALLRGLGVRTYVSHSSLSADERRLAEKAFAEEPDCVIVATSTLELGIDVGDLDRVIQIDAPESVASFLQRMGRTGRRSGSTRNCLFLTTSEEGLMIACAIVRMWREGYVEAIVPPEDPWHLIAQQAMALVLQNRGLARQELESSLTDLFGELDATKIARVIATMLERSVLWQDPGDGGLIGLGEVGEREFGRRHFESIVSTFNSPLLLTVLYGQRAMGFIDPMTVQAEDGKAPTLILGGRYWRLVSADWKARVAWVEPSEAKGKASWLGSSKSLQYPLCQAIKQVLIDSEVPATLSARAKARLAQMVESFETLDATRSTAARSVRDPRSAWRWWTFAGGRANFVLSELACAPGTKPLGYDNFSLRLPTPPQVGELAGSRLDQLRGCELIRTCLPIRHSGAGRNPVRATGIHENNQIDELDPGRRRGDDGGNRAAVNYSQALSGAGAKKLAQLAKELKFGPCLPDDLQVEVIRRRLMDPTAANRVLQDGTILSEQNGVVE